MKPNDKFKRSVRLAHNRRKKLQAKRRIEQLYQDAHHDDRHDAHLTAQVAPRLVGMAYRTPCPCSCHLCGNMRRYGKGVKRLKVAELRAVMKQDD